MVSPVAPASLADALVIPDQARVPGRLHQIAGVFVPAAGREMAGAGALALRGRELVAQEPGEQVVVAIPLALAVEGDHEHAVALEPLQDLGAPGLATHGLAQRGVHALEDRRAQQEATHLRRLTDEHLACQVVHDVAVVAREGGQKIVAVLAFDQRQGRQLQAADPALGRPRPQRPCPATAAHPVRLLPTPCAASRTVFRRRS